MAPLRPLAVATAVLVVAGLGVAASRMDVPGPRAAPAPRKTASPAPRRAAKPKATPKPAPPPPLQPVRCAPDRPVRRGVAVTGRVVDAWDRPLACAQVVLQPKQTLNDVMSGIFAALTLGLACRSPGFCDWPGATVARTDRDGRYTAYVDDDRVDHTMTVATTSGDTAVRTLNVRGSGPVRVRTVRLWSFAPRAVRRGDSVTVRFTPPPGPSRVITAYVVENGHEVEIPWVVTNTLVRVPDARSGVTFDARRVEDRPATLYVSATFAGLVQTSVVRVPPGPRALSRGARCTGVRGRCVLTDGVLTARARPPYDPPLAGAAPGIDLGRVRRLRYVVVHGCGTGDLTDTGPRERAEVEVSRDGRAWLPLPLGTERVGLYGFDCLGPVNATARYVRVRGAVEDVREIAVF